MNKRMDRTKLNIGTYILQPYARSEAHIKDLADAGVDFVSMSAHKLHGPKGIGAAYIKGDDYGLPPFSAFMHGGKQENGMRGSTLSVHNIVGFGKAAEIAIRDKEIRHKKMLLHLEEK